VRQRHIKRKSYQFFSTCQLSALLCYYCFLISGNCLPLLLFPFQCVLYQALYSLRGGNLTQANLWLSTSLLFEYHGLLLSHCQFVCLLLLTGLTFSLVVSKDFLQCWVILSSTLLRIVATEVCFSQLNDVQLASPPLNPALGN